MTALVVPLHNKRLLGNVDEFCYVMLGCARLDRVDSGCVVLCCIGLGCIGLGWVGRVAVELVAGSCGLVCGTDGSSGQRSRRLLECST